VRPPYFNVSIDDLTVDPRYQRDVDAERVRQIADNFDMKSFGPLPVYMIDGGLVIRDGQTRLVAAVFAGLKTVPAYRADEVPMGPRPAAATERMDLMDINDPELEAIIKSHVTDATWLIRRSYVLDRQVVPKNTGALVRDLALEMRDEFMREWMLVAEHWNAAVDELIDYVQRKGETPEISIGHLMAVRL
jgi:hypothetical protein